MPEESKETDQAACDMDENDEVEMEKSSKLR